MISVFFSPAYVAAGYSFDTTRKARWIADSLSREPIRGVEIVEPAPLTAAEVAEVHDPQYVRAIQTGVPIALAESQGFDWDRGLWPMVLASNGGAVAAALSALTQGVSGSLSSGLHHARRDGGTGFCTFNGLAIAARRTLGAGARSVLILDLDAHCGGGTASLIENQPRIHQIDVSVCAFDDYTPSDRVRLDIVSDASNYLETIRRRLDDAGRQNSFDLCLYNAGMDPFEGCPTGGLPGITAGMLAARERLVFDWCRHRRLPIAFVLAGGYVGAGLDQHGLVDLHRLTLSAAAETRTP